jgi:hypothetical protein
VKQNGEVTFFFLRDKKKFPVACVAYTYDEKARKIKFGVSTHNPLDEYDKQFGKILAAGRMLVAPTYENIHGHIKWNIIATVAMGAEGKPSPFPSRTKEAATAWVTYFQKTIQARLAERQKVA